MATIDVKDAGNVTRTIEAPNANGRVAAAASRPVALSTEDKAAIDAITAKLIAAPATEATLALVKTAVDAVTAKLIAAPATETTLALVKAAVDAVTAKLIAAPATEGKQDSGNTLLGTINTSLGSLATQATSAAILAKLIAAPSTEAKQDAEIALLTAIQALITTQAGYLDGLEALLATVGTRAYSTPLTRVAVAASTAQSAAITATEVMLHSSTRCFVLAGSNPAATTDCIPLEAGEKFHLRITSGHKVAVIRDTADGFLNIVPVA